MFELRLGTFPNKRGGTSTEGWGNRRSVNLKPYFCHDSHIARPLRRNATGPLGTIVACCFTPGRSLNEGCRRMGVAGVLHSPTCCRRVGGPRYDSRTRMAQRKHPVRMGRCRVEPRHGMCNWSRRSGRVSAVGTTGGGTSPGKGRVRPDPGPNRSPEGCIKRTHSDSGPIHSSNDGSVIFF